jgi:intracellular multiplication protein IcmK
MDMLMKKKIIGVAVTSLVLSLVITTRSYADDQSGSTVSGIQSTSQNSHQSSAVNNGLQNNQSQTELFGQPSEQEVEAFRGLSKQSMPMTPDEIIKLHRMLNMTQKAAAASPTTPPVPETTTRMVSLAPGVLPPVIRLAQGFISSLVFVDSTGQPWPIASYDVGNSQAFNVQAPQKGGNMLMVQAMSAYTYGNIAVKLQDLPTPIMLTLIPGQQAVDYRVDLHIDKEGPNAKTVPGGDDLPQAAGNVLLTVLNGITPEGAKVLVTSDADTQAWVLGGRMFLRTKLTIISPSWISMMRSADGTIAYEMQKTPRVLVSEAGQLVNLKIEGL